MTPNPRLPPHNLDAERAVLGAVFLDGNALALAADVLRPEDFYRENHATIYRAMLELDAKSEPLDQITVADNLRADGKLDSVGGLAYLFELNEAVATAAAVEHHARMVRDKAVLRGLIARCGEAEAKAYEADTPPDELLANTQDALYALGREKRGEGARHIGEGLGAAHRRLLKRASGERPENVTETGFYDFDGMVGGLTDGHMMVVAGRPSMGKTSFAMDIGREVAVEKLVPYFSLEMTYDEILERFAAQQARVDLMNLSPAHLPLLVKAFGHLSKLHLHIDDTPSISPQQMQYRVRRIAAKGKVPLGLIVVDYLQLMTIPGRRESKNVEIEDISRALKGMAKFFRVPIIVVSQLNRKVEERADRRPNLSDLRDSGAIEQDADEIVFIFRPFVYDETHDPKKAELLVRKNRFGPTGDVEVNFDAQYTSFSDRERWRKEGA